MTHPREVGIPGLATRAAATLAFIYDELWLLCLFLSACRTINIMSNMEDVCQRPRYLETRESVFPALPLCVS